MSGAWEAFFGTAKAMAGIAVLVAVVSFELLGVVTFIGILAGQWERAVEKAAKRRVEKREKEYASPLGAGHHE